MLVFENISLIKSTKHKAEKIAGKFNLIVMDYVDLVVTIEANFGVKLGEADFVGIATFQNFYDLIENKIKVKENA